MTTERPRRETIDRLTRDAMYAMAMVAGMQLEVFTPLKDGPRTAEQISASLNVQPDKLRPLLYGLAAAGLLEIDGDQFCNTREAQSFLVGGTPDSMLVSAGQLALLWTELLGTAESIRTGVPQSRIDYSDSMDDQLQVMYDGQYPRTVSATHLLLRDHDFSRFRRMADVGGGSGALGITMAEAFPDLQATVIDLPSVTPFTKEYLEKANAGDRVGIQAANAVTGPLSGSFDLAILRSFIQVLPPDLARNALKNIAQVMEPGGVIHIWGEGVLDDSKVSPLGAVRFGLSAVNRWDGVLASTETEHKEWLSEAGFEDFSRELLPDGASFITAIKPR